MSTELHIEHQCPQCGAPAQLAEMDRLFACPFCRVRSYLLPADVFRYVLPHRTRRDEQLIYIPYWRFKGTFCSCVAPKVDASVVDATVRAVRHENFPDTLGLRPQAMGLRFATPETCGRFIRPQITAAEAVAIFGREQGGLRLDPELHQEFLRESLSLIYHPYYIKGRLFDGVRDRAISPMMPPGFENSLPEWEPPQWDIRFVPVICPQCGWDLEGERDSLLLTCGNCGSAWEAHPGGFEGQETAYMPEEGTTAAYLPFWRIEADVEGIDLRTYADLAEVTNLPQLTQPGWEVQPFHFWVPGFRTHPEMFLNLARTLCLTQPPHEPQEQAPSPASVWSTTVPLAEARRSLMVILSSLMREPATLRVDVRNIHIAPRRSLLTYIPFQEKGTELAHLGYRIAVRRNALVQP